MIGNKKHYLIAGASGLIGSALLNRLLEDQDVGKVTILVRESIALSHKKIVEQVIDWDTLTEREIPPFVDAVFCCLGTTMKKAGNKAAFKLVDFDYVLKLAVFSQRKNIPQFHVISAAGADPNSKIFYNRVKGNMELELVKLKKIRSVYVYQPSMLLGDRKEFRLMETLGKIAMRWFAFLLPSTIKAIHAEQVAMAMISNAHRGDKGFHIVSNKTMLAG